jgi:predicted dehydrogenase
MMGREFVSAAARWCHLTEISARPEIVAVCNRSPGPFGWFRQNFPSIKQFTSDYKVLLANPEVEAVYIAVPHHLHQEIFSAAIRAASNLFHWAWSNKSILPIR